MRRKPKTNLYDEEYRSALKLAHRVRLPQAKIVESAGDAVLLMMSIRAWKNSTERMDALAEKNQTSEHRELLRFIEWALDSKAVSENIKSMLLRARPMVERGGSLPKFKWIRTIMDNTVEYTPKESNLTRKKAPWKLP